MVINGRTAIVTGAARGIGKAIVERFVEEGATVAVADIDSELAQATAREMGGSTRAVAVDVSDRDSVEAMVRQVESELGPIDVLVNNAGVSDIVPFLELDDDTWEKHLNTNLKGTFLCSQSVLRRMVPRANGKIVNISSQSGKKGTSQYEAYCASKFGIIGLTQSLAAEFAAHSININAICPGFVFTPLWEQMLPKYASKQNMSIERAKEFILSRIPLSRFGRPEDVAGVAVFLASKDADYLTGQAINVTGGVIMH